MPYDVPCIAGATRCHPTILLLVLIILPFLVEPLRSQIPFSLQGLGYEHATDIAIDTGRNLYMAFQFSGIVYDIDPGVEKRNLTSASARDVGIVAYDRSGSFRWVVQLSAMYGNVDRLKVSPNDELVAVGTFYGPMDIDPGPSINLHANNGQNDAFIARIDRQGALIWFASVGGADNERINDIAFDAEGNMYLAGTFRGTVDLDPGPGVEEVVSSGEADLFLLCLSAQGEYRWGFGVGGPGDDVGEGTGIAVVDDVVILTGSFHESLDADPGPETTIITSNGITDILLCGYDLEGGLKWASHYGGSDRDEAVPGGIVVDAAGDVLFIGNHYGNVDLDPSEGEALLYAEWYARMLVVKIDRYGTYRWGIGFGGNYGNSAIRIAADDESNIYVCGMLSDEADMDPGSDSAVMRTNSLGPSGARDAFLAKYDESGRYLWAKNFGAKIEGVGKWTNGTSLAVDSTGSVVMAGGFRGMDFDADPGPDTRLLWSRMETDLYLLSLNEDGTMWDARLLAAPSAGESEAAEEIAVMPNPVEDLCMVRLMGSDSDHITIDIVDLHGRQIAQFTRRSTGTNDFSFDVSGLSVGYYFLNIKTERGVTRKAVRVVR